MALKTYWLKLAIIFLFVPVLIYGQRQNTLSETEIKDGWELLFDGKTTKGWHSFNYKEVLPSWSVNKGELNFKIKKEGDRGWDLVTDQEFDNFDLRIEWKISKGGNSGIFYGVKEGTEYGWASSTGVEMQILDNIDGADRHDPKHLAGAMYDLIDASNTSKPKSVGEWNETRILKNNGQITFWLNGIVTANIYMGGYEWEELVSKSKWNGADKLNGADFGKFQKGKIALQDHFDEVSFRNIKIKKLDKVIGLQLFSLRDDIVKDFDTTIKAVADMGYRQVEAANYDKGRFYGFSPLEYKTKIEDAGLTSLSSHTGYIPANVNELISPQVVNWWKECIAAHKEAGVKYLVIPAMPHPQSLNDLKAVCEFFNKIGKQCKESGIKLGYHNHASEFSKIGDQVMYDFMLENTDPEYVFFEMDIYWTVIGGQGPVEYFKRYPGRFKLLHVKDRKELGQSGLVDFQSVFNNANVAGVEGLIVEVEQYSYSPIESVKKSFDYLLNSPFVKPNYP